MDVDGKKCCFCGSGSDDEVIYGKFYEMNGIQTHYYCLLLSSNMQQHGKDDEGILGFLITDIQKEISRGKRLKCSYCHKNGATLGCCKPKCKKVFHLPCGRLNNSLHHFFGEFKSYCSDHRPVQAITTPVLEDSVKSANDCAICFEIVECWPNTNTLWAPCCSVNSWFHRNCIQKLALSAGYFFKCPLCNNKDYFQVSMLKQGIYIPEQDASWELVPNAFAELLERYEQCDADICLCPMGRKGVSHRTRWDIVLCRLCGSQGIHIGCGKLKTKKPVWDCSNCTSMLESAKMRHSTSVDQSGTISNSIDEPEEVNNSDRMRRSRQLLSNTVSQDTGCSRNIDNESHLSNIIGDGEPRSNNKAIKSDTKIETIPSDDDIQVIAVFSPKFPCAQCPKLLTTCGNTSLVVSHLECGSIAKSGINTLDEPDVIMKGLHHLSEEVVVVVDSEDSLDCVITEHKRLSIDKISDNSKLLDYKTSNSTSNIKFEDSLLAVESSSSKSSFHSASTIVNLVQDSEEKQFSLYNTCNIIKKPEREITKSEFTMDQNTQFVNEKEMSTVYGIGYQDSARLLSLSDESSCEDDIIDVEN